MASDLRAAYAQAAALCAAASVWAVFEGLAHVAPEYEAAVYVDAAQQG